MSMDPKKAHELDQETGAMHELATKLGAYFRSLRSEGFTRAEALHVVTSYQTAIVLSIDAKDSNGS